MLEGANTRDLDTFRISGSFEELKGVDTKVLKDQVVELLRNVILSGKIRAGGRINESQIARDLGVSRIPIREALQQLEQQGLVVTVPRRGKFVISLMEEEIQKINSLRIILEAEALRLCRAKITPEGIAALQKLAEKMDVAGGRPEIEAAAMDLEFHRAIWRNSGSDLLAKTLEGLSIPLFAHRVLWRIKQDMLGWASILRGHHWRLLDFVQGKINDPAERIMLDHLSYRYSRPERFSSLGLQPGNGSADVSAKAEGDHQNSRPA
jgi:DNA-binding GntR family transcriptional regulator